MIVAGTQGAGGAVLARARAALADGNAADAERLCRAALASATVATEAQHLLGLALYAQGRRQEALRAVRAAADGARDAQPWFDLGVMQVEGGDSAGAIESWRRAIDAEHGFLPAWKNLVLALVKGGRWNEAATVAARARRRFPEESCFAIWHGHAEASLDRPAAARRSYRRALVLDPSSLEARYCLALAERDLGAVDAARVAFETVIGQAPDFADAHFDLAQLLLAGGDFECGLAEHEWRLKRPESRERSFPKPRWDGIARPGLRLLVYGEQGVGDVIQFVRFVQTLAERRMRVTLACHDPLVPLLAGLDGVERVVRLYHEPNDFDAHVPVMSLAHCLGIRLATIPGRVPYLPVPDRPVPAVLDDRSRPAVGVVWAGNPLYRDDRNRSITLDALAPLAAVGGVRLFSLQVGSGAEALRQRPDLPIVDLSPHIADYADSAAIVARLDLVISVDTSVAHLAGALGRPTWIILAARPDWRWLRDRDDSPWYPTARLFRRRSGGDWGECIARVAAALRAFAAGQAA